MPELIPANAELTDEDVAKSQPRARAFVLRRLEMIWEACEPHIDGDGGKPDPRFIEAGIRVMDRYTRLFRLDHPQQAQASAVSGSQEDARAALRAQVKELSSRLPD